MISVLLIIIAAIANAICDKLQFHFSTSIFPSNTFWNPQVSWKNKWKNGDKSQGEKFFGSSTFLVFTTDAWHLFKMFMLVCISLAIVFYSPITKYKLLDALILHTLWGIIFELVFKHVLTKREL
jgi:hypothetical protein